MYNPENCSTGVVKERETLESSINTIFNVLGAIESKLYGPIPESQKEACSSRNIIASKIEKLENIGGRLKGIYDVINEIE